MALPNMTEISTAIRGLMPQLRPTPVGLIGYFHDIPDGWLLCNGAAVSRTTYAKLFNVIGTRYGDGDGSTTFNLPNLEGRFLESTTDVSKLGQFVEAGLPDITGEVGGWYANSDIRAGALSFKDILYPQEMLSFSSQKMVVRKSVLSAASGNSIYGSSGTVQPTSVRLLPCIRI